MNLNEISVVTRLGVGSRRPGPLQRTTRIALAVLLALSHPLWAATIVVDETTCTLVDAITAANTDTVVGGCAAGSGADTLVLTSDVTLTEVNNVESGNNGLPLITSEIAVEGGGFRILRSDAAPPFRIFKVRFTGMLSLTDVALENGETTDSGGALFNSGTVSMVNSTLAGNSAHVGGAIRNSGSFTLTNSTVADNIGSVAAGGIYNCCSYGGPTVTLTGSTVSGNSGSGTGGGILTSQGTVSLTNSTVSGNSASLGGGIRVAGYALVVLTNSTVVGNVGGGISRQDTYPIVVPISLTSSIFGDNSSGSNCQGAITLGGTNFSDDATCGSGTADITPGVDFDTTLAGNGGPTLTHALLPGSVAIDAAGDCGLDTDQRGLQRGDGACDSGSFEYGATPADADQDGVLDDVDVCLDTTIPESVPTNHLQVNRWALVDEDGIFDTTPPPGGGGGPDFDFTVADTGGCSCEQIIEAWALGWGHTKFGCSTGAMLQWIAYVGDYSLAQVEIESGQSTPGAIQTPVVTGDDPSASAQGTVNDPDTHRGQSLTPRRTPRPHNRD